jgi:hypothetical protein
MGLRDNRSQCDEFRGSEPAGATGQDFVWLGADEKSGGSQMNARKESRPSRV